MAPFDEETSFPQLKSNERAGAENRSLSQSPDASSPSGKSFLNSFQSPDQREAGRATTLRTDLDSQSKPDVVSKTQQNDSFSNQISDYQQQLDAEFEVFERSLDTKKQTQSAEDVDWDQLERKFNEEVKAKAETEQELMNDFAARFQQFLLWIQVSNAREAERAVKRLRTKILYVRHSEVQLVQKQDHYAKVLAAFQNAMALLGNL